MSDKISERIPTTLHFGAAVTSPLPKGPMAVARDENDDPVPTPVNGRTTGRYARQYGEIVPCYAG